MDRPAAQITAAARRHVPLVMLIALVALLTAIVVVDVGLRDPGPGMLVRVPTPDPFVGPFEQLRSVPLVRIDDPRAAAVASGVIFGSHRPRRARRRAGISGLEALAFAHTPSNGQNAYLRR